MQLILPYLVFCKGSSQIVIRSMHYARDHFTFDLQDDYFVCFTTLPPSMRFEDCDNSYMETTVNSFIQELEQTKVLNFVQIPYITVNPTGYVINMLRLYPYCSKGKFIMEKWKINLPLKFNFLPKKEIIQSHMITVKAKTDL